MVASLASTGTGALSSVTSSNQPAGLAQGTVKKSKMQPLMQKIALQRALALAAEYWSEPVEISDGESAARCGEPAHEAEMRSALCSASAWQEAVFGITPSLAPVDGVAFFEAHDADQPQHPAVKQSLRGTCSLASDEECAAKSEDGKSAASTAEGADTGSSTASDSEDDCSLARRSCWVYGAKLTMLEDLLENGIAAPKRKLGRSLVKHSGKGPKLFSGPWGRTGIGCIGAEMLVYVDIEAAREAGAELRFCRGGLELGAGAGIPASCIRKVVGIADCQELFVQELEPAAPPAVTLGITVERGCSPLAALLRSME